MSFFPRLVLSLKTRKRHLFYGGETSALELFQSAWKEDHLTAMKLLFWLRDCRGGAGNRSGFRACSKWVAENYPEWMSANVHLLPEGGRWDDLKALHGSPISDEVAKFWAGAIKNNKHYLHILACKWAKKHYVSLQKALNVNEAGLKKILANARKEHIVEHKMCSGDWQSIDYKSVPSLAMARYSKAFEKHDPVGFAKYKKSLEKAGDDVAELIHADVLFPHNCLRTALSGDAVIAESQFKALPNYMEGTTARIMPICDFSGSMSAATTDGKTTRMEISRSLGLYCSDRLGKDNPFYRKFIEFSTDWDLVDWSNQTFVQAIHAGSGNVASTNIEAALMGILKMANMFKATNDQIPNVLLILSDMQFDQGTISSSDTVVESCMKNWESAGYARPKLIYWNLAGYSGSPDVAKTKNVALVSGFSPSILAAILGGKDFSPMAVMNRAIAKYEVVVPRRKAKKTVVKKTKKFVLKTTSKKVGKL